MKKLTREEKAERLRQAKIRETKRLEYGAATGRLNRSVRAARPMKGNKR